MILSSVVLNLVQCVLSDKVSRLRLVKIYCGPKRHKMSTTSDCFRIGFKEKPNASLGERFRAVGMCYYGSGQDVVRGKTYKLERNSSNIKDTKCIEIKQHGQVRATLNAKVANQLASLMDNSKVWDATW